MKKIVFLAVAGALFVSSTAMAQNYNNCDGSSMGYHRNMTSEQHNQMMKDRAQYHNNGTYHKTRMKQVNNSDSNNYMNRNQRNNNGYHMNSNNHRGQGRANSNW